MRGKALQLDKLAFCLAHPALHCKLNFALRQKSAGWIGGSIDLPEDARGNVYINAADPTSAAVWRDAAEAQRWIVTQLAKQGSTMRAAA